MRMHVYVSDISESKLANASELRSLSTESGISTKIAIAGLQIARNSMDWTKLASMPQFWQK
jgi:hypothetical protein